MLRYCDLDTDIRNDIESVTIYTLYDFDDDHPAGSNITDKFTHFDVDAFSENPDFKPYRNFFYIMEVPYQQVEFQFVVDGITSDGVSFSDTTTVINLIF